MQIKKISEFNEDISQRVVSLHKETFPDGLTTYLGDDYLKYFYNRIVTANDSVFFGSFDDQGKLCGFVGGCVDDCKFFDFYHKLILVKFLLCVMFNFKLPIAVFFRTIIKVYKFSRCQVHPELLSLAVDSDFRRQGIAGDLVNELICFFKNKKLKKFRVVTDGDLGRLFYSNFGMDNECEFKCSGVLTTLFVTNI